MKFPIDIKIYFENKYVGNGRFIKEHREGYTANLLSNFYKLNGHYENKEETGFKYGDRFCWDGLYSNLSNENWVKTINKKIYSDDDYHFEIIKENSFKEIEL